LIELPIGKDCSLKLILAPPGAASSRIGANETISIDVLHLAPLATDPRGLQPLKAQNRRRCIKRSVHQVQLRWHWPQHHCCNAGIAQKFGYLPWHRICMTSRFLLFSRSVS
jgi:hypothetical protein